MSVLHETKIEHARDAALGLTSEDLPYIVRKGTIGFLTDAYTVGEDLPEDGSGEEQISETLALLSQARIYLEACLKTFETTEKARTLLKKIIVAEEAVINYSVETRKGK